MPNTRKRRCELASNVICEKPFTLTTAQAEHLFQLAESQERFLFEAIVTQHMPNYHAIKKLLGQVGKIKVVQSNFSQYSSRYAQYLSGSVPNVFSPQWGGGALADIGIYCLHFIVGLFNEPRKSITFLTADTMASTPAAAAY